MTDETKPQLSSIEVNKTSTGKYGWNVKVYFKEGESGASLALLISLESKLKEKYGTKED